MKDLLVRARVSRVPEAYRANSAVALCLRRLEAEGISIPPGQCMKYLILDQKHPDPARRYRPEPLPFKEGDYDACAYQGLLHRAYAELTANLRPEESNLRLW